MPRGPRLVRRRQPAARRCSARWPSWSPGRRARSRGSRSWSTSAAASSSPTCAPGSTSSTAKGVARRIVFLEASDDVLVRRFEHVRRPHPLQGDGRLVDGIQRERELLARAARRGRPRRSTPATSTCTSCATKIEAAFAGGDGAGLRATVVSFGYKYGLPVDADLVVDCRFLPNPHWGPELRPYTGTRGGRSATTCWASPARSSSSTSTPSCSQLLRQGFVRRGQALRDAGRRLHRRQAPQRGHGRASWPTRLAAPGARRQASCTATWAGNEQRRVVALGGGHGLAASLAALRAHRGADGGRHRRRRRRLVGPAARRAGRARRRATCGWRSPPWPATTSGARDLGRAVPAPVRQRRDRWPATRSATCCWSALAEATGDPVGGARPLPRGCCGAQGRVLPMSHGPHRDRRGGGRAGDDPRAQGGPRPGRGRHDARPGVRRRPRPGGPAGDAGGGRGRARAPTGWCSGPGSCSRRWCRTCSCPSCARRSLKTSARRLLVPQPDAADGGDQRLLAGGPPGGPARARA